MSFFRLRLLPCLCLAILLGACGDPEDTRPGQPVKTRQDAFHQLLRSFEPMGKMLRENRFDADRFTSLSQAYAARVDAPWPHFGPDTLYPPSKARPEVWQQGEAFTEARERFLKASADFVATVPSRDKAAISARYQAVYDSCQACHDKFRQR